MQDMQLVKEVKGLVANKGCTPGQLALVRMMARRNDVVPNPGTKRIDMSPNNIMAAYIQTMSACFCLSCRTCS